MKHLLKTILFGIFFIVLYLVIINVISSIDYSMTQEDYNNSSSEGSVTEISFSDSISVLVVGHRWYGKIISDGNTRTIYLLSFIPIITQIKGFNFIGVHISFITILFVSLLLLNLKWRKKKNEKVEEIPTESPIDSSW